jgi:hypothetical protein
MLKTIIYLIGFLISSNVYAQNVGINATGAAPSTDAMLDISSTNKGLLIPRLNIVNLTTIAPIVGGSTPGLLVFNTNASSGRGYHYWSGSEWVKLMTSDDGWQLSGNLGTNSSVDFIGTTDSQALTVRLNNTAKVRFETNGTISTLNTGYSVFLGENAGINDDLTDNDNVFIGYESGTANTTGYSNVAMGKQSLYSNTTGSRNSSYGDLSLYSNTTGYGNCAFGRHSMKENLTGERNVAVGHGAILKNTSGNDNTGIGTIALYSNTTGNNNTSVGSSSMRDNTTGSDNVAVGTATLLLNTTGSNSVAIGDSVLANNTGGFSNTGVGSKALLSNTSGAKNTALGVNSLYSNSGGINNTAVGYESLSFIMLMQIQP